MSRPTPPPSPHPDDRARNGGTSAPSGGSVWDVEPVSAPDDDPIPESTGAPSSHPEHAPSASPDTAPVLPPTPSTPSARPSGPLLGSTLGSTAAAPPRPTERTRPVAQTPNARQRDKARRAIAAAAAGEPVRSGPGIRTVALIAAGIVGVVTVSAVAWILMLGNGDTSAAVPVGTLAEREPAPATTLEIAPLATVAVDDTDLDDGEYATTVPMTTAPTTTVAATTTAPTTTTPTTTATTTTAPTTTAPTTTVAVTTTVPVAASGPRVVIEPRRESCKFGPDCLVVGFTLIDVVGQPDSFVCEFADGSRYTIPLANRSVSYACATGSLGDSITIEVDGVRSDTVVHG